MEGEGPIKKPYIGLAAGSVALATMAILLSPASSFGAVNCTYSSTDRLLSITAADAFAGITRSGDAIDVDDGFRAVSCEGGPPTVLNTDRVQVTHSGRASDRIDLSGGPFPGTRFGYTGSTAMDIHGSGGPDQLTLGPSNGINLNGDGAVDVTGPFTSIVLEGGPSDDLIGPQTDWSGSGAHLILAGGGGKDHLTATPEGGVIHGGEGRDTVSGGPGPDNITGGEGKDLIRAGKGRDIIRAIDGTRDRLLCGPGFDKVKVDSIDKLRGCERLIVVKGPRR